MPGAAGRWRFGRGERNGRDSYSRSYGRRYERDELVALARGSLCEGPIGRGVIVWEVPRHLRERMRGLQPMGASVVCRWCRGFRGPWRVLPLLPLLQHEPDQSRHRTEQGCRTIRRAAALLVD